MLGKGFDDPARGVAHPRDDAQRGYQDSCGAPTAGRSAPASRGSPCSTRAAKMVGFLSIGDLLKAVFPSYMALMNIGDFSWDGMVEDMANKVADRRVVSIMTTAVISVHEEAPLMVCIDHMIKHGVKRLPVIGADGRVTGILYERDVFEAICDIMLSVTQGEAG